MVSSRSKTAAEAASQRRTTRAGAASKGLDVATAKSTPSTTVKRTISSKKAQTKLHDVPSVSVGSTGIRRRGTYCICESSDNGTPMVQCEGDCKNWFVNPLLNPYQRLILLDRYHFNCVGLSEDDAGEISKYQCDTDCV